MNAAQRESFGTALNVAGAATTVVKIGPGTLVGLIFNKPVAAATITIYDNTSAAGTKIGTVTQTADVKPYFLRYDAKFSTGLTIVTSGADDITVVYA